MRIHFCASSPRTAVFNGLSAPLPFCRATAVQLLRDVDVVDLRHVLPRPPTPPFLAAPSTPLFAQVPHAQNQIVAYAAKARKSCSYIGMFSLLAYAVSKKRLVRVWITPTDFGNVVQQFAPWFMRACGDEQPLRMVEVAATIVHRLCDDTVEVRLPSSIAESSNINNLLPLIASPL